MVPSFAVRRAPFTEVPVPVRIALFSQSLAVLDLKSAIFSMPQIGTDHLELACGLGHLDLPTLRGRGQEVLGWLRNTGVHVAAMSTFNTYTAAESWRDNLDAALEYLAACPAFQTDIMKIMPGGPLPEQAEPAHYGRFAAAMRELAPAAEAVGVRLAIETHLNQLSASVESTLRLLDENCHLNVGVNLDFANVALGAGDDPVEAISRLGPKLFHAHVKNGRALGEWTPLDQGVVDYPSILARLREVGYDGFLAVECLGPDAKSQPIQTARRDVSALRVMLSQIDPALA